MTKVAIKSVKHFWEKSPLCSIDSKFTIGSKDFFKDYDFQREQIESIAKSYEIHESGLFVS